MSSDWHENPGRPPRWKPETLILVEWANGRPARRPYRIDQLKWERRGRDFDINRFRKA